MLLLKPTLIFMLAMLLGAAGCATTPKPATQAEAPLSPTTEASIAATAQASESATDKTKTSEAATAERARNDDTAAQPSPTGDRPQTTPPSECQGFGECAGQAVKDIFTGILALFGMILMVAGTVATATGP